MVCSVLDMLHQVGLPDTQLRCQQVVGYTSLEFRKKDVARDINQYIDNM